ncbi:MAG: hypothetical protein IJA52_01225 [Clostridia bacterium]|nr:hypothetical protein [Clostridia bacterium]
MANKNAPLFKKAFKGYDRDDVNAYILSLNKILEENKLSYDKALRECNTRAEADYQKICELTEALAHLDAIKRENEENASLIASLKKELEEKDARIAELSESVATLSETNKVQSSANEDDRTKAEYYDNLCAKAGEILVIASGTAESILNRANEEACKIVGEANDKKDLMLKKFSNSVEDAAEDINSYIRTAVSDCIAKINKSVNEIKESSGNAEKKPAHRFINGN